MTDDVVWVSKERRTDRDLDSRFSFVLALELPSLSHLDLAKLRYSYVSRCGIALLYFLF